MKHFGLYLDIPFCRSKCIYCDFPSYTHMEPWHETVVQRMIDEMKEYKSSRAFPAVTSVYIGGGTPSLLDPVLFDRLLSAAQQFFLWHEEAEITAEMNPGTLTEAFLDVSRTSGVNRVSLGAQSGNDRLLKALGRIHSAADISAAVCMLRNKGFRNINLDMMIGLPGQTVDDIRDTIRYFVSLQPQHISCYSLIVEEGTPLFDAVHAGQIHLPEEDLELEMSETAAALLEAYGYHRYEISNYALEGFQCRHNLDCWNRQEYLGIGVSAASLLGHTRLRNPSTISAYLQKQLPERIELTDTDERFESIMLGLRLTDGISDREFFRRHNVSMMDVYPDVISKLIGQSLLEWNGDRLRCTDRGLNIQNYVLTEFM